MAAGQLSNEMKAGRLERDSVAAVLSAGGDATSRLPRDWPAGLTDREVEVLRLLCRLANIRSLTSRPVGANFLIPILDRDCLLLQAHGEGGGLLLGRPGDELVAMARAGGALACWQVGSAADAAAAERSGCDFVMAQDVEAGGHIRSTLGLLPC